METESLMQLPVRDAGHTLAKRTGASALIILTSSSLFMICTCVQLSGESSLYGHLWQLTISTCKERPGLRM